MSETEIPISDSDYDYVLHAIWRDEHGHAAHRVIHSSAKGEWDPKALIDKYISCEHPQWLPEGVGRIGYAGDQIQAISISVFKVVDSDLEDAFEEWTKEAIAARLEVDKARNYKADMATIAALQKKWEIDA